MTVQASEMRWKIDPRGNLHWMVQSPEQSYRMATIIKSYSAEHQQAWSVRYHDGRQWQVVRGVTPDLARAKEVAVQRLVRAGRVKQ